MKSMTELDGSAGVPPPVAGASRPRFGEVHIHDRGRLPHWEKDSATYFITFRLADSLPKSVLDRIASERQSIVRIAAGLRRELSADEHKRIQQLSAPVIERFLDSGAGAGHFQNSAIAQHVANALQHFEEKRYRLFAWTVMSNHVHVVARLFPGRTLATVIHSWKSLAQNRRISSCGPTGLSGNESTTTTSFETRVSLNERFAMWAKTLRRQILKIGNGCGCAGETPPRQPSRTAALRKAMLQSSDYGISRS